MLRADDWHDAPLARKARRNTRIALACYLVPMTVATHWPRLAFEGSGTVDKFVHFVGFGLLAWLFLNAGLFRRPILNFALAVAWVYIDEVTQAIEILGRTFSGYDMIAGWLGCAVAGIVWWGTRLRAPHGTEERLADLTAERLVYAEKGGWLRVGASVLAFALFFVGGAFVLARLAEQTGFGFGNIVFPAGLALLVGVAYGGVGAFIRSNARVARGRIDPWTGAVEAEAPAFRQADYAPALRLPLLMTAPLLLPAWLAVWGLDRLLFAEVTDAQLVDQAGFAVLQPSLGASVAFAAGLVASGALVRFRRARTGYRPQRPQP